MLYYYFLLHVLYYCIMLYYYVVLPTWTQLSVALCCGPVVLRTGVEIMNTKNNEDMNIIER